METSEEPTEFQYLKGKVITTVVADIFIPHFLISVKNPSKSRSVFWKAIYAIRINRAFLFLNSFEPRPTDFFPGRIIPTFSVIFIRLILLPISHQSEDLIHLIPDLAVI